MEDRSTIENRHDGWDTCQEWETVEFQMMYAREKYNRKITLELRRLNIHNAER